MGRASVPGFTASRPPPSRRELARSAWPLTCQTGAVRDVVILGSTGSIGTQALEVVADQPGRFRVVGAGRRRQQHPAAGPAGPRHRRRAGRPQPQHRRAGPAARPVRRGQPARLVERRGAAAPDPGRPGRGARGGHGALRRGAQRHHRLGRAGRHPGRPGGGPGPGAGQQGVAGGRRAAGHPGGGARADGGRRLRALGPGPVPARRRAQRGRPADPDRERRTVPRPHPGADARRHARRRPWSTRPGRWAG